MVLSKRILLALSLAGLVSAANVQAGERTGEELVQADLIASVDSVKSEEPFQVAVRLKIESQWHTYWLNPGDAGQAPEVKWTLPDGATVSALSFPVPNMLTDEYKSVIYGYENEVILLATITPGKTVPANFDIKADVSWLVCREKCLMGKKSISLKLTPGSANPANTEVFTQAKSALPQAGNPADIQQIWTDATHGKLVINWSQSEVPDIFPPPAGFAVFEKPVVANGSITIPYRVLKGQKVLGEQIPLIVAIKKDNKRSGFEWKIAFKQP